MSRKELSGLIRRILALVVLTAGLVLASSGLVGSHATAAICCEQCWINFDNCLNNCNDDPGCVQGCNTTVEHCLRFCNSLCN